MTPKRHILGPNHIFWYITCLGPTFGLSCGWVAKNERYTQKRYILPIRGEAPSHPIFTKFCTGGLCGN
jgi:hypothetical protein